VTSSSCLGAGWVVVVSLAVDARAGNAQPQTARKTAVRGGSGGSGDRK